MEIKLKQTALNIAIKSVFIRCVSQQRLVAQAQDTEAENER